MKVCVKCKIDEHDDDNDDKVSTQSKIWYQHLRSKNYNKP